MESLTDLTGRTLGKYRVIRRLGRGGMAEVYLAYQTSLERHVALKVISPYLLTESDFLKRFEREAKSVAALRHPHIVQVFDYDVEDDLPYMVMEYIEGDSLKGLLDKLAARGGSVSYTQAARLTREIGSALGYAHAQGVIHRDVKPANVMLDKSGRAILTDFGVAKMVGGATFTTTGVAGTPAYMSPEQALGEKADARTDLYALGVILFEMVTGQTPFNADTPMAIMLQHAHAPRPSPRALKPDLHEGLERLILKSLARDPRERFQSAEEMVDLLGNLGAAAQLLIPKSAVLADAADARVKVELAAEAPPAAPPVQASASATRQDVARTTHRALKEIACANCTGAGLELQPEGRVVCQFCNEVNEMAGPVCANCERVNTPDATNCEACGSGLFRSCPKCDTKNWSGAERCVACGQRLDTLSALIDRSGDRGLRYTELQRQLADVATQDEAGSQKRMAYFNELERQRQAALAAAQARKAREQRTALFVTFLILGLILVGVVVVALLSSNR